MHFVINFTITCILLSNFRGAFSVVKKCVGREDGVEYAAKIITKRRLTARGMVMNNVTDNEANYRLLN